METLTKEFFVEQFDSFRTDVKKEFGLVRAETKEGFDEVHKEIAELTERTSSAFTGMTEQFIALETRVADIDTKVDTLVRFNHQHQIDVLRDDMRIVKTKLGIA